MDEKISNLLDLLSNVSLAEQELKRTKLKIQLRHIMAIDNLSESIDKIREHFVSTDKAELVNENETPP